MADRPPPHLAGPYRAQRYMSPIARRERMPAGHPPTRSRSEVDASSALEETFPSFPVDVAQRLPAGMALLFVYPQPRADGREGFRLRGVCCSGEELETAEVYGKPDLDLGSLVSEDGVLPADVLSFMQVWSRPKTELVRWLDRLRAAHGDELELVIWDETGYRIPWELLWLEADPASDRADGWLGGLVTVTRWLTIHAAWEKVIRDFRDAHVCTGPVAAFIDEEMMHDKALFESYQVEHSGSMYELATALQGADPAEVPAPSADLALVYVACHAEFGDQVTESTIGRMPLVHFDPMKFRRLARAATFVFLNACHSGSLGYDTKRFNDHVLRGFSEVFLRSGAAGVLATGGSVGNRLAYEMASELLTHLESNPGTSVAAAVREVRARAAKLTSADLANVEGVEANKQLLPLLYRFMYICYGSPRTVMVPASRARDPRGRTKTR